MNGTRIGADYKLGSMVTFNCEAGYLLQGYSTLTCVMGSSKRPEWDRAKPSCQGERRRWCVSRMAWRSRLRSSCGAQYLILCDSATQLGKKKNCACVCMQAKQLPQRIHIGRLNSVGWTFTEDRRNRSSPYSMVVYKHCYSHCNAV